MVNVVSCFGTIDLEQLTRDEAMIFVKRVYRHARQFGQGEMVPVSMADTLLLESIEEIGEARYRASKNPEETT